MEKTGKSLVLLVSVVFFSCVFTSVVYPADYISFNIQLTDIGGFPLPTPYESDVNVPIVATMNLKIIDDDGDGMFHSPKTGENYDFPLKVTTVLRGMGEKLSRTVFYGPSNDLPGQQYKISHVFHPSTHWCEQWDIANGGGNLPTDVTVRIKGIILVKDVFVPEVGPPELHRLKYKKKKKVVTLHCTGYW